MDLCRIDQARRGHATDVADESGRPHTRAPARLFAARQI
jgi:hypothetical protein